MVPKDAVNVSNFWLSNQRLLCMTRFLLELVAGVWAVAILSDASCRSGRCGAIVSEINVAEGAKTLSRSNKQTSHVPVRPKY